MKRFHYSIFILGALHISKNGYCRTHNVSVCLYIAFIACGSASLYIKTLYFFLTVLALSAADTVANIKIRYDAKIPQFAILGTRVIYRYVFYSIQNLTGVPSGVPICHRPLINCRIGNVLSGLFCHTFTTGISLV